MMMRSLPKAKIKQQLTVLHNRTIYLGGGRGVLGTSDVL